MSRFFLLLAFFIGLAAVKAATDSAFSSIHRRFGFKNFGLPEGMTIHFDAATTPAVGASTVTSNLRPAAYSTASQWILLNFYTSTTCGGSAFQISSAGLNQCYPLATEPTEPATTATPTGNYAKFTISGANYVSTIYSDDACATTPITSVVVQAVNTCAPIPGVGSMQYTTSSSTPPAFGTKGLLQTYYGTSSSCTSASGAIVGYQLLATTGANNCLPASISETGSTGISCSGSSVTGTQYTGSNCQGTGTPTTRNGNSQCADSDIIASGSNTGPYGFIYYGCYNGPAAAASSSDTCFAGSESVSLASGATIPISEVKVGDKVLAFSTSEQTTVYSDVVATPHPKNNIEAAFQHITLASGADIKMTADHLISTGACGLASLPLVRAADVQVGDCVQTTEGTSPVVSNTVVTNAEGVYTIVTDKADDLVVINGIIASPFAVNHVVANAVYNIYRVAYGFAPKLVAPLAGVMTNLAAYFAK